MRMRRGLAVLLALVMALSLIPTAALAAEPEDAAELLETAELPEETPEAVPEETVEEASGQAEAPEEIETSEQAEAPEEVPEETPAQLLQARIDALPEANTVAELMDSAPEQVDAVYEEVCVLAEAVEALEEPLDTTKLDALVELFTPKAEVLATTGTPCTSADCSHVAAIGDMHYDSLDDAVTDVQPGETIQLLKDITLSDNTPLVITGKDTAENPITLDLAGYTISGKNTKTATDPAKVTATNPFAGILVVNKSHVKLTGTENGSIENTATSGSIFTVLVTGGGTLTIDGGIGIINHGSGNLCSATAVGVYGASTLTIDDANVEVSRYAVSVDSKCSATINGGTYTSAGGSKPITNTTSTIRGKGSVIINGGTFNTWDKDKNNTMVPTDKFICISENGGKHSVTVRAEEPTDYLAMVEGTNVYQEAGSLYKLLDIGADSQSGTTLNVQKSAEMTFPNGFKFGSDSIPADKTVKTMTLNLSDGVELSGSIPMAFADITVNGGTVAANVFHPYTTGLKMTSEGQDGHYTCGVDEETYAAKFTNSADGSVTYYFKTTNPFNKLESGTLYLNADISNKNSISLSGKNLILDLNGYTYKYTKDGTGGYAVSVQTGTNFTLKNSNSEEPGVFETEDKDDSSIITSTKSNGGTIVIDQGVTVKGGILLQGTNPSLTVKGTVTSEGVYAGIQNNGSGTTDSIINIEDGAEVSGPLAIYHPGPGTINIKGGTITGENAGIEIRAGDLTVTGGTITGTASPSSVMPNGNGSTSSGAGIAVAQHTTKLPINVTISGGEINGFSALYESNPEKNSETDIAQVKLTVTGGNFAATNGGTQAVYSEDCTGFISGGYYTSDPSEYVVAGKAAIDSDKPGYDYMIGIRKVDVETAVAAGDAAADVQITDTNVTAETVKEAANDTATQTSLTDAAKQSGMSNDPKVVGTVENAEKKLEEGQVAVTDQDITVVIQPYLDVAVQSYTETDSEKSMTVDIKALYDVVATTDPDDIRLTDGGTGKEKNAVALKEKQIMKVTTPVTIKLPLPTGFVSTTSDPVFVQHDGKYEYTATVTGDTTNGFTAEFINPHGFSTFVLSTKSAAVAKIGENSYTTLQAAVDAVENGGTINVLTADQAAKVNSAKSFTLTGAGKDTASITAGSGLTVSEKDDVYTAVKRPSSSGSGSDDDDGYTVTVEKSKHGDVTVSPRTAEKGETVTITVKPDKGYRLYDLTVTAKNGKELGITQEKSNKFTFKMPDGAVTVEAAFVKTDDAPRFIDVPDGYWAEGEIEWAAGNGYMNGNTDVTFNPEGLVTRQQLWMILARLSGYQPADFAEARIWAMNSGISDGTFPGRAVSRQQLVTILYRYARLMGYDVSVGEDTNILSYHDAAMVSEYAIPAMQWATGAGIVQGTGEGNLMPLASTTRAQFAVILSRFCEDVVE